MKTISSALFWAEQNLSNIEENKLEARILLSDTLSIPSYLLCFYKDMILPKDKWKEFKNRIEKRKNYEPLQYLRDFQYFLMWDFNVTKNVFIPRPETELLVEYALALNLPENPLIVDLCCGSGVIGISLAKFIPGSKIYAVDISSSALKIAEENAKKLKVNNISFIKGNLFLPLKKLKIKNEVDLIISNPPYIPQKEWENLPEDVKKEPKGSLIAGKDGLFFHKKLISSSGEFLKEKGFLILEVGFKQKEKVISFAKKKFLKNVDIIKDYGGEERGVVFTKN